MRRAVLRMLVLLTVSHLLPAQTTGVKSVLAKYCELPKYQSLPACVCLRGGPCTASPPAANRPAPGSGAKSLLGGVDISKVMGALGGTPSAAGLEALAEKAAAAGSPAPAGSPPPAEAPLQPSARLAALLLGGQKGRAAALRPQTAALRATSSPLAPVTPAATAPRVPAVPDRDLPRFHHPKPVLRMGLRPRALAGAPWAINLLDKTLPAQSATVLQTLSQIESLQLSMAATPAGEPEVLILVTGDFSSGIPAELHQLPGRLYRVSDRALLAGEAAPVRAAFARLQQRSGPLPAAAPAAAWVEMSPSRMPEKAQLPAQFAEIAALALRIDVHDGIRLEAQMEARSPEAAEKALAELRRSVQETPGGADLLDQAGLRAEGPRVRLALALSEADWEKAFGPGGQWLFSSRPPEPHRKAVIHGQ